MVKCNQTELPGRADWHIVEAHIWNCEVNLIQSLGSFLMTHVDLAWSLSFEGSAMSEAQMAYCSTTLPLVLCKQPNIQKVNENLSHQSTLHAGWDLDQNRCQPCLWIAFFLSILQCKAEDCAVFHHHVERCHFYTLSHIENHLPCLRFTDVTMALQFSVK